MNEKITIEMTRGQAERLSEYLKDEKPGMDCSFLISKLNAALQIGPANIVLMTLKEEAKALCEEVDGILFYCDKTQCWDVSVTVGKYTALAERRPMGWFLTLVGDQYKVIASIKNVSWDRIPALLDILGTAYDCEYVAGLWDCGNRLGPFKKSGPKMFEGLGWPGEPSDRMHNLCNLLGPEYKFAKYRNRDVIFREVADERAFIIYENGECFQIALLEDFGRVDDDVMLSDVPVESISYLVERLTYYLCSEVIK